MPTPRDSGHATVPGHCEVSTRVGPRTGAGDHSPAEHESDGHSSFDFRKTMPKQHLKLIGQEPEHLEEGRKADYRPGLHRLTQAGQLAPIIPKRQKAGEVDIPVSYT